MKPAALFIALGVVAAAPVFAQSAQSLPPAPPPPGMNDPGVKVTLPPKPATAESSPKAPAAKPAAKNGEEPKLTECTKDDNTIQEYRRSGALYQVVVKPKFGPEQVYLVDPKGNYSQVSQSGPREPVKPVMYKVLEWGKSRPAEDQPSCSP
ncbi:DUF2782 domain-containing protein [Dyella sp. 2RAB6]|uniref:DUF2782 domain-containing protein n=1 Tax=Dyella sp. 2RAB6 TaxID=3232992 RepID=UPI003F90C23B